MSLFKPEWAEQYLGRNPRLLLDVGCWDAADSIAWKARWPDCQVVAFEACPDNFAAISAAGRAAAAGVDVLHMAIADHEGTVDFWSCSDTAQGANPGMSGSILTPAPHLATTAPNLTFKQPRTVRCRRLDTIFTAATEIDVLHMDVQGAESLVLTGLGDLRPAMIFLETDATQDYVGAAPKAALYQMLAGMGYVESWRGAGDSLFTRYSEKPIEIQPTETPRSMRNPLDDLTVCITSFRRAWHLDRALRSIREAGIRRVAIAAVSPTREVRETIAGHAYGWTSFDVNEVEADIGCNETWVLATYLSRTPRIIVLHDDDVLMPGFAEAYRTTIDPHLRSGVGFASWRAWVQDDLGRQTRSEYFRYGETAVLPSSQLWPIVAQRGRLSLSPVVSVLDRETTIHACKEAGQTLRHNDCLERPGMLLGTEILVYLRHIQRFRLWLFVDRVLSLYGSHPGSGTVRAQGEEWGIQRLARGYDVARNQGDQCPATPEPRLLIVTSHRELAPGPDRARIARARASRRFLCETAEAIEVRIWDADLPRAFPAGNRKLPYLRDLIDAGASRALPEDIIFYCNDDLGLVIDAPAMIRAAVDRGRGTAVFPRRSHDHPRPLMRSVLNCQLDGGIDSVAMTPTWWTANREKIPDMVIGAEGWDTVVRVIAEEWADGGRPRETLCCDPHGWAQSRAYLDGVCWHEPHRAPWKDAKRRGGDQAGIHNRTLFREFFADRGNQDGLLLSEEPKRKKTP